MNVLILGVGDAFSSRHFGSSALIKAPNGYVLIDCPDPIHRVLRFASAKSGWDTDAFDIDDIILTHLHGDHCNGLESFAFTRRLRRMDDPDHPRPRLHATRPVSDRLWERLAPAMDAPMGETTTPSVLEDYFELHELDPEQETTIAGLTVNCRVTKHPIPTIGLKFSDGSSSLGWSGDTPFEHDHIDWLAETDLIVHESNRSPAHTPIEDLNALPTNLRKKMRLIHLPDEFDRGTTDIKPLDEGDVLNVNRT